jgi:hypothetical protein
MDFDEFLSCYFTFTVEGDEPDAYEALFAFRLVGDSQTYLVYTDAADGDDFATYGAAVLDPAQVERAQAASDAGRTPKEPVVLALRSLAGDPAAQQLVEDALQEVMSEED